MRKARANPEYREAENARRRARRKARTPEQRATDNAYHRAWSAKKKESK